LYFCVYKVPSEQGGPFYLEPLLDNPEIENTGRRTMTQGDRDY